MGKRCHSCFIESRRAKRAKGHLLWNAGRVVSGYLEENAGGLIRGRDVLELGAGAGLPSLVCAARGARTVSGYLGGLLGASCVDGGPGRGDGLSGCGAD